MTIVVDGGGSPAKAWHLPTHHRRRVGLDLQFLQEFAILRSRCPSSRAACQPNLRTENRQ